MNDIEFARCASPALGNLYEQAKKLSPTVPAHALTFLREFAGAFCDSIDSNLEPSIKLEDKIRSLRDRRYVDNQELPHLRKLQADGNIAAHPKAFDFARYNYAQMAEECLAAARQLIEHLYLRQHASGQVPVYTVAPVEGHDLKQLSYMAVFEEDSDARYLLGVHFKEKANSIRDSEFLHRADDGYGFGSRKYIDQANHWFQLAAHESHAESLYEYGAYLSRLQGDKLIDRQMGERHVWQASEKGHAGAQALLGDWYFTGSALYEQDLPYARKLYRQAAAKSHPGALAQLGKMLEQGLGGPVDMNEALQCSLQAAEAGFPQAQFHLYTLHKQGHALSGGESSAIDWLGLAAEQKLPEAMLALAELIRQKRVPGRQFSDARALYERCINNENTRVVALYALAQLLAENGDEDDLQQALYHIENCKDEAASNSRNRHLIPACQKLGAAIRGKLQSTMASKYPHMRFVFGPTAPQQSVVAVRRSFNGVGRNEPCPCGRPRKFKKCCGARPSLPD